MTKKTAVIIGAGPAGLTAAFELLKRTNIHPIIFERDPKYVGGISRTIEYKGNAIDIGGHRFFSKSDRVMKWWSEILPVAVPEEQSPAITFQNSSRGLTEEMYVTQDSSKEKVFSVRPRKTRILYGGKLFPYPVELSYGVLKKLGIIKTLKISLTYARARFFPVRPEKTLEDFFINRFGSELYQTFFKTYTEKVWGVSCTQLSAEWGAQRIKGLSIAKAITYALKKLFNAPVVEKEIETSLIEQFLYPTKGPGMLWEEVANQVRQEGGEIRMHHNVAGVKLQGGHVHAVVVKNLETNEEHEVDADYVFSTTDIASLVAGITPSVPKHVSVIANNLEYRDFITVGLLLKGKPKEKNGNVITDTWMYIHEPSVQVGRIQFFHNWHPSLVANPEHGWVGLEYFCNTGDAFWRQNDLEIQKQAAEELERIGLGSTQEVIDSIVIRQPKAYPGYFGAYKHFEVVRDWLDSIPNLFPVGRNGMHRYNNQDHSMLAAMTAVDLIAQGNTDKTSLWEINTEEEYHEEKK